MREARIRQRFVRRAVRLARYRGWCLTLGLTLAALAWLGAADAWACRWIRMPWGWRCW